jgi:type II secretory pathway pseudopilin PulG
VAVHTHTHTHVYSLDEEKNDGITLIALIITIIVLLILAGVAISLLLGDNGVITRAQNASDATKTASVIEDVEIVWSGRQSAYYEAYSKNSKVNKDDYFEEEDINKELSNGTIVEDSYTYNSNGETTFTYEMNTTGEKYGIKVTDTGNVSITSYNGVSLETKIVGDENFAFPQIISKDGEIYYFESKDVVGEKITKDNLGKYLGKAVKYVPSNSTTNTSYGTGSTYRLFYIDFTGKYGDEEEKGTIYLKADCDDNYLSLVNLPTNNSSDNYAVMQKLNPSWIKPDSFQYNDIYISRLLDPANWTDWKDTTTEGIGEDNINYVVGSPSLEMYVDSYNAYLDSHRRLYMNESETNLAEKLTCEYVTSGYSAKGYILGSANVSSDIVTITKCHLTSNSLISSSEAGGMYNNVLDCWFLLASPSAYGDEYVVEVSSSDSSIGSYSLGYEYVVCPLVSLKPGVTLELENK